MLQFRMTMLAIQIALVVFNVCFSLHMKKKGAELWWLNIPVAVFCFIAAMGSVILIISAI